MKYPDNSSIISDGKTTDRSIQSTTLDAPYGLLVFLAQSRRYSTRRLSRAEALLRLLQRYVNSQLVNSHAYNTVSFQMLADEWGWERTTVRKFFIQLQKLDVIGMHKLPTNKETVYRFLHIHTGSEQTTTKPP